MQERHSPGFTLVEIMIVVAIIGLLATIAIPSFLNARVKSQRSVCVSHLRQISGAKDQFALTHLGAAPAAMIDLVPEILKRLPQCPAGGSYTLGDMSTEPICSEGLTSLNHRL